MSFRILSIPTKILNFLKVGEKYGYFLDFYLIKIIRYFMI
jgi:hypothetical protein